MACVCPDPATRSCEECQGHEAARRASRLSGRIERSGIPRDLRRLSLLGAAPGDAKAAAEQWARGETLGLCLTGPVGVGKTWLAAAAAWKRLELHSVKWVSVARLMTMLRAGFESEMKQKADQIVAGNGAIVLDDLDKVNPTAYGKEVLFAAIDGRVEEGAPLLITTNKAVSELGSMLGDPIASRLAGYCTVVRMQGADRRLS